MVDVGATNLDQVVNDLEFAATNRIVKRRLPVFVNDASLSSVDLDQAFHQFYVTFSTGVEYWRLNVGVELVDIAPLPNKNVHQFLPPFPARVEQSSLVQSINDCRIYTLAQKVVDHPHALAFVLDLRRIEDGVVVVFIVLQVRQNRGISSGVEPVHFGLYEVQVTFLDHF